MTYTDDGPPPEGVTPGRCRPGARRGIEPGSPRPSSSTPLPKNPCCDRQEYTVVITYADGTTETFRTVDGLQQPAVFEDLLSMLG